jgi:hypothetical protein
MMEKNLEQKWVSESVALMAPMLVQHLVEMSEWKMEEAEVVEMEKW